MSELLDLARLLLPAESESRDDAQSREIEHRFVEEVTYADGADIVAMIHDVLAADWLGFPVWARNLSYRLACLAKPDDRALWREAAADLRSFGPDWDDVAARLNREGEIAE